MSNNLNYFDKYEPFKKVGKVIVADSGSMKIKGKGTVTCKLDDDNRVMHKARIKNSLFVPNLDYSLLLP